MMDHDYTTEFKWEKPLLSLNQLALLAVLNSERKSLSPESIAGFLYKHFPYYNDTPLNYIVHFLKTANGLLQRAVHEPGGCCEYYIPADKEIYCIKRFQRFYSQHRDPKSSVYSMRFPGFWDLMVKGEYREAEPFLSAVVKSQPTEWPKPPIPERYLIALAIFNSQTGRLLASEIFAFIERHFPYYKTADKKWKKQNANEALKAARGIFGREKLSTPNTDRLGNGILNVYYIKEEKMAAVTKFFEKLKKEHPDPKTYGIENPDVWPQMIKGELKHNEEELRKLVFSSGKAKSQLASTDRNPYEKSEECSLAEVVKPILGIHYYALLAYLHSGKKLVSPREFQKWMKDNVYYFNNSETKDWKPQLREALHQYFNKVMVGNERNDKKRCMMFGLFADTRRYLIKNLLNFERGHPEICIEDYGVATEGKWSRLFPRCFKELATIEDENNAGGGEADWDVREEEDEGIGQDEPVNDKEENGDGLDDSGAQEEERGRVERREADDIEEFVDVEDYNWFGGTNDKSEKAPNKNENNRQTLRVPATVHPPQVAAKQEEGRYQTRGKRIDFNKMLSFDLEKSPAKMAKKEHTTKPGSRDRKRGSGEAETSTLKRSKRGLTSRYDEEEDVSSTITLIPTTLLCYLAMQNSDQKMCSLDEIMGFLCFYFACFEENREKQTAAVRSLLLVNFTKRDSFDANGNAHYGFPPSTDKALRRRVNAFASKFPRSLKHVYALKNIALWEKMQRGELREHLGPR